MLGGLYSLLTVLLYPLLRALPHIRARSDKEIPSRISERYGISMHDRPKGKLVWIHAASNGEALSALPLIESFRELPSAPTILVTTMTVTAAKLMNQRLPEGCIHQFIPLDYTPWISRFHNHWQPDAVFWIESELWPNHLKALKNKNIPSVLLNSRLSEKSVKRWSVARSFFQSLLSCFSIILAQTTRDQGNLESLGIQNVQTVGNLKDIALPLPYDPIAFDDMRLATTGRTLVLFASTHGGEEKIAADIHQKLKPDHPDLLSIIIPRHPKRGNEIFKELQNDTTSISVRSLKMSPRLDTDIYIADTLGELGLFYRLCDIVFVGNSMHVKPGGGHNLLEPALLDCAIVSGDDLHNFSTQANEMPDAKACTLVKNKKELCEILKYHLEHPDHVTDMANNALSYATKKQTKGLDNILEPLQPLLQTAKLL